MGKFIFKFILLLGVIAGIVFGMTWYLKRQNNNMEEKDKGDNNKIVNTNQNKDSKIKDNLDMALVLDEKIKENAVWAGTNNLVWNEMLDKFNDGKPAESKEKNTSVDYLNKKLFTKEMVPDSYYYIKSDKMKKGLKEEIEKGIKEKFNETSNILDKIDWTEDENRYLIYSMLFRKFEFKNKFNKLENGEFKKYKNVKYFGTEGKDSKKLKDQIEILYYISEKDFALSINTKDGDKVVVNKNPKGESFYEIYKNILKNKKAYDTNPKAERIFNNYNFKMPNIDFTKIKSYEELKNVTLKVKDNGEMQIEKVIQGIEFKLDEKGGRIKSETAMPMWVKSMPIEDNKKPKKLYIDDTFALFVQKENKVPFFALKVDDISLVQNDVHK